MGEIKVTMFTIKNNYVVEITRFTQFGKQYIGAMYDQVFRRITPETHVHRYSTHCVGKHNPK